MKVLLDTCVWGKAKTKLIEAGHDVEWAGDWPEDPGDEEILMKAHGDGRVLVTLDKDFGELAIVAAFLTRVLSGSSIRLHGIKPIYVLLFLKGTGRPS